MFMPKTISKAFRNHSASRLPAAVVLAVLTGWSVMTPAASATQAADTATVVAAAPRQLAISDFRERTAGRTISPVEGVWSTGESTIFSVVRSSDNSFDIVLYASGKLDIPLPLAIGHLTPGGRPGLYDARIARNISSGGKLSRMASVCLRVSDNASWLEFHPYKKGVSVNFRRLLPYMFRFSISQSDTRPEGLNGARRIFPRPNPTSDNPLIL